MPGKVVDLSIPGTRFPDPIVVDTNLIVERLVVSHIGALPRSSTVNAQRASQFFQDLAVISGTGIVTPTVFNEFVHTAVRFKYQNELLLLGTTAQQVYGRPISNWRALYKQDAAILRAFGAVLQNFGQLLIANDLLFVSPDELGPIASGRTFDEELVHLVSRYGLDSNDALILMEAQRCGVTDVVTLDPDLQRAQADFDIYTWL